MQYLNVIFGRFNILVRLRCSCSSGSSDGGAPLAQLLAQLGEELSLLPPVGAQSGLGFLNFDTDTGMKTQYSEIVKIK